MSIGADMAVYLQALGYVTHTGTPKTLFRDMMPATPDVCWAIFESGGGPPTGGFGMTGIDYEAPSVQLRFRGAPEDSTGPHAHAHAAYQATQRVGVTINGTFYHWLKPQQPPFIFERDDNKRVVWAFNVASEKDL